MNDLERIAGTIREKIGTILEVIESLGAEGDIESAQLGIERYGWFILKFGSEMDRSSLQDFAKRLDVPLGQPSDARQPECSGPAQSVEAHSIFGVGGVAT